VAYYFLIKLSPIFVPPLLFWVWIRRLCGEDWNPRPFLRFFFAGAILVLPLFFVEQYLSRQLGNDGDTATTALREGFLITALPEEVGRALLLAWWVVRRRGFARPRWIISVAVALAMGQVAVENLAHFYFTTHGAEERLEVWLMRVLFCVPTMGFYGLAMGVMAAWKLARQENWVSGLFEGAVIAAIGHGLYDSALIFITDNPEFGPYTIYAMVPITAAVMIVCYLPVRQYYTEVAAQSA
jgi:RsiW-degrading membrane proteinase PrsW (M82 family)